MRNNLIINFFDDEYDSRGIFLIFVCIIIKEIKLNFLDFGRYKYNYGIQNPILY